MNRERPVQGLSGPGATYCKGFVLSFLVRGDFGILFFHGRRCLLIFQAQAFHGFEFFIRHSIKMYLQQRKNCEVIGDINYYY